MGEPYIEWKTQTQKYMVHDFIYKKLRNQTNLICGENSQNISYHWSEDSDWERTWKPGAEVLLL